MFGIILLVLYLFLTIDTNWIQFCELEKQNNDKYFVRARMFGCRQLETLRGSFVKCTQQISQQIECASKKILGVFTCFRYLWMQAVY